MFLTGTTNSGEELVNKIVEAAKEGDNGLTEQLASFIDNPVLANIFKIVFTLFIAFVIYAIGRKVIKWILKVLKVSLEKSSIDEGVSGFLVTLCKVSLNIILIIIVASNLGVESSSWVALIGSAGLTVGLAVQGSLSNFAGGVLILVNRPFKVGDYIIAAGNEGTVSKIDIFYTRLVTIDNKLVVLPNGTLSNLEVINVTNEEMRRLDLFIPVSYSSDIDHVKSVLKRVVQTCESALEDPEAEIFLYSFEDSSIKMAMRIWVRTEEYWPLKWEIQEKIKKEFDREKISIPFNQLDVKVVRE